MNRLFSTNGEDKEVIKNVLNHYEHENIIDLNFDVFLQSNLDYENEFIKIENQINKISVINQIEYFEFIKEVASYVTGTKIDKKTSNFKVNSNEYRENKRIEIDFFESQHERIDWVEIRFYCSEIIEFLELKKIELFAPQQTKNIKPDEIYKTQYLFKVGLFFAKGTMNKYFELTKNNDTVMKSGCTPPKIAKELGDCSYNKYILASINNYKDKENANKNIFNSPDMMSKIISHCEAEKIPVDDYFKSRLPTE